ncbi:hypothetical protein DFS34DRAFT_676290 [Phlyctochytrium arcticum]|nr:hypothetical protein DFS34DRAFT_676290 [Phlyctochytrium arcticum]
MLSQPPDDLPSLKFTSIPLTSAYPNWNSRNVQSGFAKATSTDKRSSISIRPVPEENFSDILVIHPGSRFLRIGRASDAVPKEVPHVIVRRLKGMNVAEEGIAQSFPEAIRDEDGLWSSIQDDIKQRMRAQKVRSVPNAHSQVVGYNSQAIPEAIADHNDPYKVEWTELGDGTEIVTGSKALRIGSLKHSGSDSSGDKSCQYKAFYPIQHGMPNMNDYSSIQSCLADMQTIWTDAIETELGITRSEFNKYNVVWLIPDLFSKSHVRGMISMLLRDMGFRAVSMLQHQFTVWQESVAATFGAGVPTACVIDIGAQKTSVSCIEDGVCIPDARVNVKYGGDDMTAFLMKVLLKSAFPYKAFDPKHHVYDWLLADELKEKFCTFNEADLIVNYCTFYVRAPEQPTQFYKLKVYDEVLMAPRLFFHPEVVDFSRKLSHVLCKETYLDCFAEDDAEHDEIPYTAAQNASFAYQSYVKFSERNHHDSPRADNVANPSQGNVGSRDVQDEQVQKHVKDLASEPTSSKLPETDSDDHPRKKARSVAPENDPSNQTGTDAVSLIEEKSSTETDDVMLIHPPPLMHFLRSRRFMGPLSDIELPLDVAVAHSIGLYAHVYPDMKDADLDAKIRKLCSTILIVGGGGMVPGFAKVLEEHVAEILQATPLKARLAAASASGSTAALTPRVLQKPRDIDSRLLCWKGGSVFSKLELTGDMWLGWEDWGTGSVPRMMGQCMFAWE